MKVFAAIVIAIACANMCFAEMRLAIDGEAVSVEWEKNAGVDALRENAPLTIQMRSYGGFEQVGNIGLNLPSKDERIKTQAGDIMLYSGNQIVIFFGSNTWEYTRLGRVTDKTPEELAKLLGGKDVTLTISGE